MRIGGLQKCSLIDYPQKLCAIVFTIGCNFRCPYCHNPELVDETADEISTRQFFSFLEKRIGKLDAVTITGGEPTLHDDLVSFIEQIKHLGFLVKLDSNGTNPGALKTLQDKNLVDYIAMDIKAPLYRYTESVARPVDVQNIQKSIGLLIEGNTPYEFRTTTIKSMLSFDDFRQIGETIKGAKTYYLQRFVPSKLLNPGFMRKTTYTDKEFEELKKIMETYVHTCHIR